MPSLNVSSYILLLTLSMYPMAADEDNTNQIAFLDHAYTTLDRETIKELDQSKFLREFAFYEHISHQEKDGVRVARYLMGRSTYIELYAEGERKGPAFGLGIMSETPNTIEMIEGNLSEEDVVFKSSVLKRPLGGEEVEFIRDLALGNQDIDLWIAEYIPSYMNNPLSKREPAEHKNDQISRERYLPDGYKEHQLRDIQKVVIELPPGFSVSFMALLKTAGYAIKGNALGFEAIGETDTIEVAITEEGDGGIREFHMLLNNPVNGAHVETIGNTSFTVGPGRRAVWTLGD